MAKSTQDVIYEGWLTKSPPTRRIWRARWRRRWFLLTHSGELPGQYILRYYTDRNCRKLKGVIDLDHCEQVDLGLKLEGKLKFDHVFDIKTPSRTYYLAADTEEEMKSWVNCICKICGLKSTNEDEDVHMSINDVEIVEENDEEKNFKSFQEITPASPVSKSPYIPISECITGKSPILDPKDITTLIENNRKNSFFKTEFNSHMNDSYDFPHRNYINFDATQSNYVNEILDPRFYDCPRQLAPPYARPAGEQTKPSKNHSPLQSPTDSDSVFNDEDWANTSVDFSTSKRPSESSAEADLIARQRFTKEHSDKNFVPPPRPPKPSGIGHSTSYLNLTPTKISEDVEESVTSEPFGVKKESHTQTIITDDMYDFPRSHQVETEASRNTLGRRHNYNNAAPVSCSEGTIFKYDISPKPSTSTMVFKYDLDEKPDAEPSSPTHSHSSSTPAYSNLPSPLLTGEAQSMPPPLVNRDLKPKRKLSDSHSISSNPEPPSPRNAPSVDRKLKPPTPLQEPHMRKSFNSSEEEPRKIRAAPSPTPPSLGRSHESILTPVDNQEQVYHELNNKMQYLDLDLEGGPGSTNNNQKTLPKTDTVYKEVDFVKTQALHIARNIQENERQERVPYVKK